MKNEKTITLFCCFMIAAFTGNIFAQDRVFTNVYQTTVLSYGDRDLEFQFIDKAGSKYFYNEVDTRLEFEMGLGKNWQTSFYLNGFQRSQADSDLGSLQNTFNVSFSNEWKWKISDPVTNAIGFGLYEEIEIGSDRQELETKILLDKSFEKTLIALNLVNDLEFNHSVKEGKDVVATENEPALLFGIMRFAFPNIGIGAEAADYNDVSKEGWEYSALFAGPTVAISGKSWFINLNVFPQIINLHKSNHSPGNLDLDDHQRVEFHALLSFSL